MYLKKFDIKRINFKTRFSNLSFYGVSPQLLKELKKRFNLLTSVYYYSS